MLVARKTNHRFCVSIGDGKITVLVIKVLQCRLTIDRYRIVHLCLDALPDAVVQQCIALFSKNNVEVINDPIAVRSWRNTNLRDFPQTGIVEPGILDSPLRDSGLKLERQKDYPRPISL